MSEPTKENDMSEPRLLKAYMDLTGSSESSARSVFMYVCPVGARQGGQVGAWDEENAVDGARPSQTRQSKLPGWIIVLALWAWSLGHGIAATNAPATLLAQPLSLAEAVDFALRQNSAILRAQKDLEITAGVVVQTRAIALPKVAVGGGYSATQSTDLDVLPFSLPGVGSFSLGTSQRWSSQVKLLQSVYEGGRVLSSFRTARLQREQSLLQYEATVSDTVTEVQVTYFDALLAAQQIIVQEASLDLLKQELTDTTRRYEAGTVPRFNVLRAEVELANARPKLIRARNSFRIAKNRLATLLGFNVPRETLEDLPMKLSGALEAEPYDLPLTRAVALAFERRPELGALRKAQLLRQEQVIGARAGYKPSIQGFVGYDAHSSLFSSDLTDERNGWIAGAQMNWNLFDGFITQGRIKEAQAQVERAGVDLDDANRRVELEVRTAFSNFIEAQEVLASQKKVQEEADEALRLARARSEAGTGTQLDVLSAQTALTEARTTQVEALHGYAVARARLLRAVGDNLPAADSSQRR